jgi:hypothetical protein
VEQPDAGRVAAHEAGREAGHANGFVPCPHVELRRTGRTDLIEDTERGRPALHHEDVAGCQFLR